MILSDKYPGNVLRSSVSRGGVVDSQQLRGLRDVRGQVYQGEGWLILSETGLYRFRRSSVSRGGVVDSQPGPAVPRPVPKCIKGRGG